MCQSGATCSHNDTAGGKKSFWGKTTITHSLTQSKIKLLKTDDHKYLFLP